MCPLRMLTGTYDANHWFLKLRRTDCLGLGLFVGGRHAHPRPPLLAPISISLATSIHPCLREILAILRLRARGLVQRSASGRVLCRPPGAHARGRPQFSFEERDLQPHFQRGEAHHLTGWAGVVKAKQWDGQRMDSSPRPCGDRNQIGARRLNDETAQPRAASSLCRGKTSRREKMEPGITWPQYSEGLVTWSVVPLCHGHGYKTPRPSNEFLCTKPPVIRLGPSSRAVRPRAVGGKRKRRRMCRGARRTRGPRRSVRREPRPVGSRLWQAEAQDLREELFVSAYAVCLFLFFCLRVASFLGWVEGKAKGN